MFKKGVSILLMLALLLCIPVSSHALESNPWSNIIESGKLFVQNSFTHEVGHVYGLSDVYSSSEYTGTRPTMYGYAEYGSRNKCTIEADDKAGMRAIYGGN